MNLFIKVRSNDFYILTSKITRMNYNVFKKVKNKSTNSNLVSCQVLPDSAQQAQLDLHQVHTN